MYVSIKLVRTNLKKAIIVVIIGFTIYSILSLVAQVDTESVENMLIGVPSHWWFFLLFSVAANFLATWAWILLDPSQQLKKVSFAELYFLRQAGESLGQLNPTGAIGGDYLKYKVLTNKIEINSIQRPLYLFRIYSIVSYFFVVLLVVLTYIIFYIEKPHWIQNVLIASLFLLLFYLFKIIKSIPKFILKILISLEKIFRVNLGFIDKFSSFSQGISSLKFTRSHLLPIFLLILHWVVGSLEIFAITQILDIPLNALQTIIADFGIMVFKTLGQVIPAQIGVEEVGNSFMLKIFGGFSAAAWLGLSLMRRLRQLFWITISLIYLMFHRKLFNKNVVSLKKNA